MSKFIVIIVIVLIAVAGFIGYRSFAQNTPVKSPAISQQTQVVQPVPTQAASSSAIQLTDTTNTTLDIDIKDVDSSLGKLDTDLKDAGQDQSSQDSLPAD